MDYGVQGSGREPAHGVGARQGGAAGGGAGPPYEERVSSPRTQALFVGLALAFGAAGAATRAAAAPPWTVAVSLGMALLFAFYALNYTALHIQSSHDGLALRFGVFRWSIPWDTVDRCFLDETSLWRIGGAGIHFTFIRGRYRVMFNFLEHQRVVVALTRRRGLVRDVVFSTARPGDVMQRTRHAVARTRGG